MPYFIKLYRKLISFLSIVGDLYKNMKTLTKKSLKANKKESKQKECEAG